MRRKNKFTTNEIFWRFLNGKTYGYSYSLSIDGDTLYHYSGPIVVRDGDRYLISNRFGKNSYSYTTSQKIYQAMSWFRPYILVDGWAEKGKKEWLPNSHKTLSGLIRAFSKGRFHDLRLGNDNSNYHTLKIERDIYTLNFNNTQLVKAIIFYPEYCDKSNCPKCIHRFTCLIDEDVYDLYAFEFLPSLNKAEFAKAKKLCEKYLHPRMDNVI